MHGGSYKRNPSAKAVGLSIRKNLLLNLQNSFHYGNCMPDNDVPLVSGDISQESAALNASLEENMDDDSFDENDIEMDNIEELPTSTCSLESCALEYLAGYITKKCIDKSQCRRCCETFLDINKFFTRNEQLLISFGAYVTAKGNVDFGNLHVPNREFSDISRIINFAFNRYCYADMKLVYRLKMFVNRCIDRPDVSLATGNI